MYLFKTNSGLNHQFPLLFDDLFGKELFNSGRDHYSPTQTTIPAVNIKETKDHYEVELAAPGMKKEDFSIRLNGQNLIINSEKRSETGHESDESYTTREFSYQSFSRTFKLANEIVDTENIKATYENGVLSLWVPKKESAKVKEPKLIQIS